MNEPAPARTPTLSLAHVLGAAQLELDQVLLIRHPLSNPLVNAAVSTDRVREYTREQQPDFPEHHSHWLVFLGEEGTSARLFATYANHGRDSDGAFNLQPSSALADLRDRLVIDWGRGTRTWRQSGTKATSKPVLAIMERATQPFPGFENLILSFSELEQLVGEPRRFAQWHAAMAAVNAVYLIVNTKSGDQYVGSAYGQHGLLGRWREYVETKHGGNVKMVKQLEVDPTIHAQLQFSVLQVVPRSSSPDAVVAVEALYKKKLLTQQFGLNAN